MQLADIQEARDFLALPPDVCLIELFLIDANGVPRGERLLTALHALEQSSGAKDALGADFLKVFLAKKHEEHRQFMGDVGKQDRRGYLTQA
ncbi:hypothetical protein [Pseudomonas sp.]|uniref:hypothetical protein n=1 Tax=Pseudomonas sp. TaxID=306 RepID=UPI0039A51DBF